VTLSDVTRPAALAAIRECDRLGREEFLRSTGYPRTRSYVLEYDGRSYDSTAIAAYAHRVATGVLLVPSALSTRDQTAAMRLRELDFEVRVRRNPDWSRDEIILACSLVEQNGWRQLDDDDPRVTELSRLLQTPAIHPIDGRRSNFRNPAGVSRKTADIATRHPGYQGRPTNGNRLDREVLQLFLDDPGEMRSQAEGIRDILLAWGPNRSALLDPDFDDAGAEEGGLLLREHLRRERDPKLKARKIKSAKRRGQAVACEACGFDFHRTYGQRGLDYIECHHRTPLGVTGKVRTRLDDLALVCSNCHRMIHRSKDWLTVTQLKALIENACWTAHDPSCG
jgi:5-methylcytosine-specific restriction enzyme A